MLKQSEIDKISELALLLRNQIKSGDLNIVLGQYDNNNFPCGYCGNASRLFQGRLTKLGFENISYASGYCDKHHSHGWLEYKGYIIDITADQFPEMKNHPIIIIKKEESSFHKQFQSNI